MEKLVPLLSKLPRAQAADLKLAELMVLGVFSKLIALLSCWANIFVYEPCTSPQYGLCPLYRKIVHLSRTL